METTETNIFNDSLKMKLLEWQDKTREKRCLEDIVNISNLDKSCDKEYIFTFFSDLEASGGIVACKDDKYRNKEEILLWLEGDRGNRKLEDIIDLNKLKLERVSSDDINQWSKAPLE